MMDGDDLTYRERINIAKIEVFSIAIHENLSIPNRIRRDDGDVIFYFKNRDTLDKKRVFTRAEKIDILEQVYNLMLFLEANGYNVTELLLSNVSYDGKLVRIHDLNVEHKPNADNWNIVKGLWKEFGRPIFRLKPTKGRFMNQSFIIDTDDSREFLSEFVG